MVRNVFLPMLLCFCAASALADQVTLKNGDRLSGTIVKTDDDKLEMKSEFAGDVKLPWSAVVAIVSAEPLHIALKNGQTIVGVVTTKDEKFEVAAPSGPIEAPKAEVVAVRNNAEQDVYMRMEHPRIIDLWAALLDTGLSLTRGNSESTSFALTGKAARTAKRTKISLYSTEIYARSTLAGVSNTTASAIRGGVRVDVNLRGRSFAFGLADFEHDLGGLARCRRIRGTERLRIIFLVISDSAKHVEGALFFFDQVVTQAAAQDTAQVQILKTVVLEIGQAKGKGTAP